MNRRHFLKLSAAFAGLTALRLSGADVPTEPHRAFDDYFLQITDARVDTGGLSGATPGEAVSWGKIDPSRLPDAVVAYVDSTVALPILTAYALSKRKARPLRRLYTKRDALLEEIRIAHLDATAPAAKGTRS